MKTNAHPAGKRSDATRGEAQQHARAARTARSLQPPPYGIGLVDESAPAEAAPLSIQRKATTAEVGGPRPLPATGAGAALPEDVRAKMEGALGMDFSAVRVHEGPQAAAMGALAYTQGTDIHFAPGQYQPSYRAGQELLGHELTHVAQQAQGRVGATRQMRGMGVNDDAGLEREADALGRQAAQASSPQPQGFAPSPTALQSTVAQFQLPEETQRILDEKSKTDRAIRIKKPYMEIVDQRLTEDGVHYRFGGSLVARLYGARRVPSDVDVEVQDEKNLRGAADALGNEEWDLGNWHCKPKDKFFVNYPKDKGAKETKTAGETLPGEAISASGTIYATQKAGADANQTKQFDVDIANENHAAFNENLISPRERGVHLVSGELVTIEELIVNYLDRIVNKPATAHLKGDRDQITDLLKEAKIDLDNEAEVKKFEAGLMALVREDERKAFSLRFRGVIQTQKSMGVLSAWKKSQGLV